MPCKYVVNVIYDLAKWAPIRMARGMAEDLRKKRVAWQRSFDAFEDVIRLRRQYYEPLLPGIDREFRVDEYGLVHDDEGLFRRV